jgi:hypothetical protein
MLSPLSMLRYPVTGSNISLPGNNDEEPRMAQTTAERQAAYRARRATAGSVTIHWKQDGWN